jgi:chromosome segregation ATPase
MKIIEIANGRSDARPSDPKSVLEQRLADLEATVRGRQKDWLAARAAAAAEPQDNLAEIIIRERAARSLVEQELRERRAQYEKDIARADALRAMVDEQFREAAVEVERARQAEASAAAAVERLTRAESDAVARLAEREAEFATELSAVTETRDGLEQQLGYIESALASARQRHELAAQEVKELTRREAELNAQYAGAAAARAALERRVAEVETALAEAGEQLTRQRTQATEQQAIDQARIHEEIAKRVSVEDALTAARITHARAEEQHRSATADAAMRFAECEARFRSELASITATRDSLEEQLRGVETQLTQETEVREGLDQAIRELRSEAAAAEQRFRQETATLADDGRTERARLEDRLRRERKDHQAQLVEREAHFQDELSLIIATRDGLEQELRGIETALAQQIDARLTLEHAIAEQRSAAADAEQRFRDDIAALTGTAQAERAALEAELSRERRDHETRRASEQQEHRSAMAAAAARLAEREAEFTTELASIAATRDRLEEQLRSVETQLAHETGVRATLEHAIRDLHTSAAAAEQRFREQTARLADSGNAERQRLEEQLSRERFGHETQLASEQQRHRTAMAAAAAAQAEREAQLRAEVASITAARDGLEEQLRGVETSLAQQIDARLALERAIAEQRSAAEEAERRFRNDIAALTEKARAERVALEDQLSRERDGHQAQLADEQQQHRTAMTAAATRLAEREAHFEKELASIAATRDGLETQLSGVETRLTKETAAREALEKAISELRSAAAAAERRFLEETAALTENARTERARLEDQLSRERADLQAQLADEQQQHRSAMATAAARLAEREAQLHAELGRLTATRASLEQQLRVIHARVERETEARAALERAIVEAQAAAAEAERRFRDEIAEVAGHANAERARLEEQMSRERAQADERLAARGAEFESELERLSGIHARAVTTFQASIADRDSRIAEQESASSALQARLDATEAENRRQFEQTPVPLVRCSRDGALAAANYAFASLVGCRAPGELRDRNFAATLFESRNDLEWLIERSVNSAKTESVETTCIRKDGARVAVRLSARPSASGLVEIAAEDLTAIRVVEDRLREAHRMEAVGRVASENAMTCEKLLRDVYREAQRLLGTISGSEGQRDQVDTLLDDVTLAGSILHQLVAYGDEQTAASAPVDVNRILHDLQPVLKQVAGDAITLELRKTSSVLNVDVNAERVERLLVNVASYGRQRMPNGGRLRIELSTVVVDGKFSAQYPNVRQGPHALITVTEVARPAGESQVSDHANEAESRIAPERPRVDLGALQDLISQCGGHLWITAEPGGSMVVRMRLPLRAAWKGQAEASGRNSLGRMTARLIGR